MLHLGSQTLNGTATMELLTCKECVRKKRVSCGAKTDGYTPVVLRRCTRPCCNHRPRLLLDDQLVSLCSVLEISTMPRLSKQQPEVKASPRHRNSGSSKIHHNRSGKRTVGPRRKTVGVISYLLLKGWTVGPRPGPWTYCPTHGFLLTRLVHGCRRGLTVLPCRKVTSATLVKTRRGPTVLQSIVPTAVIFGCHGDRNDFGTHHCNARATLPQDTTTTARYIALRFKRGTKLATSLSPHWLPQGHAPNRLLPQLHSLVTPTVVASRDFAYMRKSKSAPMCP
ncbi:hypothetical protein J6590_054166 [Homalodisca vitripennis]|nr:hypothetical protein J6590_054166 [Homalodisca vitripennis]